jgi:hypothetical protein
MNVLDGEGRPGKAPSNKLIGPDRLRPVYAAGRDDLPTGWSE